MMSPLQWQLVLSAALLTLISLIQFLHYPSFRFFDEARFSEAMSFHQNRITWIVLPLMTAELVLAMWMSVSQRDLLSLTIAAIVVLIWATTFTFQVPLHEKLMRKKDPVLIDSLVQTNVIRTVLWATKFILVFVGVYL